MRLVWVETPTIKYMYLGEHSEANLFKQELNNPFCMNFVQSSS